MRAAGPRLESRASSGNGENTGGSFMIVGVPRETFPGERRVAMVPAVIPSLTKAGLEVVVEAGAGKEAGYLDADYAAKGEKILPTGAEVFATDDIIIQVLWYGSNDKTDKVDVSLYRPQ